MLIYSTASKKKNGKQFAINLLRMIVEYIYSCIIYHHLFYEHYLKCSITNKFSSNKSMNH